MRPSRPSSTDSNALYRATTPTLIDFFAKEREEQQEIADANLQQNPLAPLSPRRTTDSIVATATEDVGPSHIPYVNLGRLRQYIQQSGYPGSTYLKNTTVHSRLDSVNLSTGALFNALQIVQNAHHPSLANLGISEIERNTLIHKLVGIVNQAAGFRPAIKTAALNAHNDPQQLIANLLECVRNPG